MAACLAPRPKTYIASGAIKANSFVKFDSASDTKNPTIVQCESGKPLGICLSDTDVASGASCEVGFPGGGARLKISGTVALGQSVKPTTNGYGIVTATAGDAAGAMAIEGGVTGDIIGVDVTHSEKYNADAT